MAEVLAPCGSPEVLRAVLRAGCDAVYLGGECFSARQNAVNFSDEEISQAVYECHKRGVKLYRTINTLVFDSQLDQLRAALKHCAQVGVDGIITQDLALIKLVRECCPDLPIHASTQMTLHTENGVKLAKELGFKRAVLARELPLETIGRLSKLGIETEVFIHGALCMSVSGQCYMSAIIGSRSANRGLCAQACRLPCSAVKGEKERCDLSLKDLSGLDHAAALDKLGVSSLKIEGRMKRPEYAAMAVDSTKKALAGQPYDLKTLAEVFSRGGFTDGYLTGKRGKAMFGFRSKEDAQASARAFPKIHELYRYEDKRDTADLHFTLKKDFPARLEMSDSSGLSVTVTGELPQQAQKKSTDAETVIRQLKKLGNTIYTPGAITCEIDEGLFFSPSVINSMRRDAAKMLDDLRAERNTRTAAFKYISPHMESIPTQAAPKLRAAVSRLSQLSAIDPHGVELVSVPLSLAQKAVGIFPVQKLSLLMPRFTFDESSQLSRLKAAKALGYKHLTATNLAHLVPGRELGFELHTGFGFNITNSPALSVLHQLGAADATCSFELMLSQIAALKKPLPIGIIAYGRLPLMLTVNCPIAQAVGCKNCKRCLTDRTDRVFPVACSKKEGYVEILNSDRLYLADKQKEIRNVDFLTLLFTDESPEETARVINAYREKLPPKGNITRGLYFRGVN
ncbi:MAG: U32 family peptidase [Ruminococcus sp.]|nr:U32 family peptidase [Ruminococcus sp.]